MDQSEEATTNLGSDRRTWLIGAIVAATLVVVAVTAVALTGSQQDATYVEGSPEAAMQAYAEALENGDIDAAYQILTPEAQARVPIYEFRSVMSWGDDLPSRVWVDDRTEFDDRVVVKLTVETTYDGFLGPDRDTHTLRVSLIEMDGAWRIDTPLMGFYPG